MCRIGRDHAGFTIVEMIVVIALAAAVTTTAAMSLAFLFSADAKACTNSIMGALSECRIETMGQGQGNVRLLLYRDNSGNIYSELQVRASSADEWEACNDGAKKIGAKRCSVGSVDGGDDLPMKLGDTLPTREEGLWEIYFDRSLGSFKPETSILDIYVQGGGRKYHIHFEELTGKTMLELLQDP